MNPVLHRFLIRSSFRCFETSIYFPNSNQIKFLPLSVIWDQLQSIFLWSLRSFDKCSNSGRALFASRVLHLFQIGSKGFLCGWGYFFCHHQFFLLVSSYVGFKNHVFACASCACIILLYCSKNQVKCLMIFNVLPGEQHTYKCLSCPFSSMTISQLKEHSLRDHGEALTLTKLRAATQAAHAALRASRPASNAEQTAMAPDGMRSCLIFIKHCCICFVYGIKEQTIRF